MPSGRKDTPQSFQKKHGHLGSGLCASKMIRKISGLLDVWCVTVYVYGRGHMCSGVGICVMYTYGDHRLVPSVFLRCSPSYFFETRLFPLNLELADSEAGWPRSSWNPAFVSRVLGLQATHLAFTRTLRLTRLLSHLPSCAFHLLNNLVCDSVWQAWEASSQLVSQSPW